METVGIVVKDEGGFLFPQDEQIDGKPNLRHGGATLRDFFAFAALVDGYSPKDALELADEMLRIRNQ